MPPPLATLPSTQTQQDTMPQPIDILTRIHVGPANDNVKLTMWCCEMRWHIIISKGGLQGSQNLNHEFRVLLAKVNNTGSSKKANDGDPLEELTFWIAALCRPQMKQLSSQTAKKRPIWTLKDYFQIETLVLVLEIIQGRLNIRSSPPSEEILREINPNVPVPAIVNEIRLPILHPSQVVFPGSGIEPGLPEQPNRVLTTAGDMRFFKPTFHSERAALEITTLLKIRALGRKAIRVPILHEIVLFDQKPHLRPVLISGMLLEYVEFRGSLSDFARKEVSRATRRKWIKQLTDGIECLHKAGVVWGDAQPENILVDYLENLWFVGFSGGDGNGWVDEDKIRSVDGDKQAVWRMLADLRSSVGEESKQ